MTPNKNENEARLTASQAALDVDLFSEVARLTLAKSEAYLEKASTSKSYTHQILEVEIAKSLIGSLESQLEGTGVAVAADKVAAAGASARSTASAEFLERVSAILDQAFDLSTNLRSPNTMGHQVNPPIPVASILASVGSLLNSGLAVFEMSPFFSAVEKALIQHLGSLIGWETNSFDGIVTSGGTLANTTALLSARNWKFPDAFKQGLDQRGDHRKNHRRENPRNQPRAVVLTSAHAHYSISRAAGILGLGTDNVLKVAVDERGKMRLDDLERVHSQAIEAGLNPFCLVGAAATTPLGAFDPLTELGLFAEKNGLWFHVDGAHGASYLLSDRHKGLISGIEMADSITWDAHKMMYVPSLCTFLLYRERTDSLLAFSQDAPYLFSHDSLDDLSGGTKTFECTKGPIAFATWALWSIYSKAVFAELIEGVTAVTQEFYQILRATDDFRTVHVPECNILCFAYDSTAMRALSQTERSRWHREARLRLLKQGDYYLTGTEIDGEYMFRVTVMNPATQGSHFRGLLDAIRLLGG